MVPADRLENNVIQLRPLTISEREKARAQTRLVEQAMEANGGQFDRLMTRTACTALASGSQIFAPLNELLAAAERAIEHAQERLQLATTLFSRQLDVLDQAKSEHDGFVARVRAESDCSHDHQRDLLQAKQIGNEILSAEKHLRLLSERHRMRVNILRTENPLVWALYKAKEAIDDIRKRTPAGMLVGKMADWLRSTKRFKSAMLAVERIDGQIEDASQNLRQLGGSLNTVQDQIFSVRNENLQRISKSHQPVERAHDGLVAAQSLKESVAHELAIRKQTLVSLKAWDHPVAKEALDHLTSIVLTASRTGDGIDDVAVLMGSEQLANAVIAEMQSLDLEHYGLIAEMHYCEEAEAMFASRPARAAGVI